MEHQKTSKKQQLVPLASGMVLALLALGAPLLWFVSTGRLQQMAKPFAYAAQTAAVQPVVEPSSTPVVLPSQTPTADLASLSFVERFELAGDYISEALEQSYQGAYADSALSWNKALEIVPDYAEGYYNRGQAYLRLLNNQRSQEEYLYYLSLAGMDFDKAIELSPYTKGDYYLGRYKYYDNLSAQQTARVDRIQYEQIALDNLLLANQLGNFDPLAERYVIFSNIVVGNCEEGIEQANRLVAASTEPVGALHTGLALGHSCKNQLEEALSNIDQAIALRDTCLNRLERAKILYAMGRNDEALADLDTSISSDPFYCGDRYYLRGLLYAEMGDLQKAEEDLSFGIGQTWGRGGFFPYVLGKIALAKDDREAAIHYFQEAEVTYPMLDPILVKIQEDLADLGASPLEINPSAPAATVIPKPTAQTTPRPISSPDPSIPTPVFTPDPLLQFATIVDIEEAVGPLVTTLNYDGLWRFQPAESLDHRDVQRLSVWVNSPDTSQSLPRQLFIWNFRNNMWGGVEELKWGENAVNFPDEYVSPDGDVYIHLFSQDPSLSTIIDTLGITLVIQRTNGSIEVHGITP